MAVQYAKKNKFSSAEALCDTCTNAVPQACRFMREKEPAPALVAMGAKFLSQEYSSSHDKGIYYKVISCPSYAQGPLPQIAKARSNKLDKITEKLDLTCPKCGSADKVKVSRTNLLAPTDWYCRCFRCNKPFRPKKKEGVKKMQPVNGTADSVNEKTPELNNTGQENPEVQKNKGFDVYEEQQPSERPKTRLEIAREKLTKEEYIRARDLGENNKQIYGSLGIAPDTFYRLLEEWGVKGYQPNQPLSNTSEKPAHTGSTFTIAQAIILQGDLGEDIDAIDYILEVTEEQLSPRVEKLLTGHLKSCKQQLERINKAFHAVEIAI